MAEVRGSDVRKVMGASTLIGDKVINTKGESLGKIDEFMVDLSTGCISYAVLSFGGFLGMGDKLFAVPMNAMTLDEDRKAFILDVSRDKLEQAPGFDKDHWPDMTDTNWKDKINNFYSRS